MSFADRRNNLPGRAAHLVVSEPDLVVKQRKGEDMVDERFQSTGRLGNAKGL
jgi:hypothetical protein